MTAQLLRGHDSPDTAYVVEDYPYGYRLRCKMRHWIEFKSGKGTRHVTQTSNPKKDNAVWNKPKASTYVAGQHYLYLDHQGHVHTKALAVTMNISRFIAFETGELFPQMTESERDKFAQLAAMCQKLSPSGWRSMAEFVQCARRSGGDANTLAESASMWVPSNHLYLLSEYNNIALREMIELALADNSTIVKAMLLATDSPETSG